MKRLWLCIAAVLCISSAVQAQQLSRSGQVSSESPRQAGSHLRIGQKDRTGFRAGLTDGQSHSNARVSAKFPQAPTLTPIFLEYPYYLTGHDPTAAAVGDFNGDGKLDLAVANQTDNTVSVLLGNGDTTFQDHVDYATGSGPRSVAVGDFNGDGKPDLAVANNPSSVSILLGNGDGTFQMHVDYGVYGAWSLAVGDLNNDGKLDLAVATQSVAGLSVLLGNGDGTFQPSADYVGNDPVSLAIADFNGDGKADVVSTWVAGGTGWVIVFLGNGDGTFPPSPLATDTGLTTVSALAVGDFNGDGKPDVAVTDLFSASVAVLVGNGDGTFQVPAGYATGAGPSLVSVGDFNGDGKLDLAVANQWDNTVSALLGNGDGTFRERVDYAAGNSPSTAIGDFNNDGKPDIAATNALNNSVSILTGEADGSFRSDVSYSNGGNPYDGGAASSLIVGDFNNDGKPDVAWTDNFTLEVLLGDGEGTFAGSAGYSQDGGYHGTMATGDFNGDGNLDLAVLASGSGNGVYVLLGNGDGTFQAAVIYPIAGRASWLVAGDFNGDGKSDIAVTNGNTVSVLLGNGDGTFQTHGDYASGNNPSSIAVGDFNHDGKSDLAVTNSDDNTLSVLLGNGDGTFQTAIAHATGSGPWSVAVADFNRDGKSDLAVTNSNDNTLSVLLGNGDGTFQARVDYPTGGTPQSLVVADFNGDGKPDVAATNYADNSVSFLLGSGDGTFQPTVQYASGQARFAALGDLNLDGSFDLAVLGPNNEITILRNIRGTTAQLKSSVNPSALGQAVTLTTTIGVSLNNVGIAVPSGSIEFTDGTNNLGTQTLGADGVVTLVVNALTAGKHAISAIYSGDANFNPHTVTLSQVVNGPDFGMSIAPDSATLSSGSSQTFALTVTAMYGFNGAVSLTCSVSPTPPAAPTCSLNPNSVTPANGSVSSTLTVSTTGTVSSLVRPVLRYDGRPYALLLPLFAVVLFGHDFTNYQKRKKNILIAFLIAMFMIVVSLQLACGGSSNPPGSGGTPAGMYTVVVNAVSGSVTHTTNVTISVQ